MCADLSITSQASPTRVSACMRALGLTRTRLLGKHVYQAYSHRYGWVAVKFAFAPLATFQLRNEAQFLAQFRSNDWPSYIDSGSHHQLEWLMTSLIDGRSLSSLSIADEQLLPMLNQLQLILQQLHSTGHIHGDIKPGNILLNESSKQLSLIDFGSILPIGDHYPDLTSSSISPRFSGVNASFRFGQVTVRDDYAALAITLQSVFHQHPFHCQSIGQFSRSHNVALTRQLPSRYQLLLQQQVDLAAQLTN